MGKNNAYYYIRARVDENDKWQDFGGLVVAKESRCVEKRLVEHARKEYHEYAHLYEFALFKTVKKVKQMVQSINMRTKQFCREFRLLPSFSKHRYAQYERVSSKGDTIPLPLFGLKAGVHEIKFVKGRESVTCIIKVWESPHGWAWCVLKEFEKEIL